MFAWYTSVHLDTIGATDFDVRSTLNFPQEQYWSIYFCTPQYYFYRNKFDQLRDVIKGQNDVLM